MPAMLLSHSGENKLINVKVHSTFQIIKHGRRDLVLLLPWKFDGLAQDCGISSVLAMEILQSFTEPMN